MLRVQIDRTPGIWQWDPKAKSRWEKSELTPANEDHPDVARYLDLIEMEFDEEEADK